MSKPQLPFHEWCIIILFCSILFVLACFAFVGKKSTVTLSSSAQKTQIIVSQAPNDILRIKVTGQVAKPGLYMLPLNTSLKELLEQSQPLPTADCSQIKWRRKLKDGQTIDVPEKRFMTIHLSGLVRSPGPVTILSGTRICDLVEKIEFLPEADIKSLKKKRKYLKEGELVEVKKINSNLVTQDKKCANA